jgi:[acyl-carrier-protein] S-malonyltransferase
MTPAAERLRIDLAAIRFADPQPPVVTNVAAEPNGAAAQIPGLLARQVAEPVRVTEMVLRLAALGVRSVIEIGPGRVLSGLVARIEPSLARAHLAVAADLDAAATFVAGPGAKPATAG